MHHVGNMILMGLTFYFLQFCIMRKLVQCGKYFQSHAVPPYTSFTVPTNVSFHVLTAVTVQSTSLGLMSCIVTYV
jgi:hypothetical protein